MIVQVQLSELNKLTNVQELQNYIANISHIFEKHNPLNAIPSFKMFLLNVFRIRILSALQLCISKGNIAINKSKQIRTLMYKVTFKNQPQSIMW